jgi:hypothetical protein
MNTAKAHYHYQQVYDNMKNAVGENQSHLLNSFILNNNNDIIKGIEYWEKKKGNVGEGPDKENVQRNIELLEHIMQQRSVITADLFTNAIPISMKSVMVPDEIKDAEVIEEKKEKGKVITHPASEEAIPMGPSQKTINDSVGEQIAKKREESAKKNKTNKKSGKQAAKESVENTTSPYELQYPTDEEKLEAINTLLMPNLDKYLNPPEGKDKNRDKAQQWTKIHFKTMGTNVVYATDPMIERLLDWVENGHFESRSPLDVLKGIPMSITDIVNEARRLIFENGISEDKLKEALKPYVVNQTLKEHKSKKDVIRTEEEYDNFFRSSIQFLFNEDQRARDKQLIEEEQQSRDEYKEKLYAKFQNTGARACPIKMADKLIGKYGKTTEAYEYKNALAEALAYIKSVNEEMFNEYNADPKKTSSHGSKKSDDNKSKDDKKSEQSGQVSDSPGEADANAAVNEEKKEMSSKEVTKEELEAKVNSRLPKLEELLKYKDKEDQLKEYLITLANKKVAPVGSQPDMDDVVKDLNHLAKKQILEGNMKEEKFMDWTESDVSKWIADEVIPYITDYYGMLRSEDEEELKSHLEFYLQKFSPNDVKARNNKIKEVLESEVPRTNFMKKKIARKVRKGQFDVITNLIKEVNQEHLDAKKEQIQTT